MARTITIKPRKFALVKAQAIDYPERSMLTCQVKLSCGHNPCIPIDSGSKLEKKMMKDKNSFFRCYECRIPNE